MESHAAPGAGLAREPASEHVLHVVPAQELLVDRAVPAFRRGAEVGIGDEPVVGVRGEARHAEVERVVVVLVFPHHGRVHAAGGAKAH